MAETESPDIRDSRVVIYMTRADSDRLTEMARDLGFKSRSEMIVAILERLMIGGFSVLVWLQTGWQFMKRMEEAEWHSGFYFGTRPLPALPVEKDPFRDEVAEVLDDLKHELETKPC